MRIDPDDIETAAHRIAPHVRETPLWRLPSSALGLPPDAPAFEAVLKLEHLQRSGSFKARGMFNRLLSNTIPAAGVIVASGGNAGIATAVAARALGVRAEVFVPGVISAVKRERLAALGAQVVVVGEAYADAFEACELRQRETGALMTHAYDQQEVVVGAGTLARELERQLASPLGAPLEPQFERQPEPPLEPQPGVALDSVLVSVGGGGLISGIAAWFAGRVDVIALEPELAPTLYRARQAGTPVDVSVGGIAADSLGARRIGQIAWGVTQAHVADAALVTDAAIRAAQRFMWTEWKLAVEPAAALPLAALQSGVVRPCQGERVCLIVCGANVDPATLL